LLLPFSGLIIGCLVFGSLGAILLKVLSPYGLTILNFLFYIIGALIGALFVTAVYSWIVAGPDRQLNNTMSVLGMIISVFVGGGLSGLLGVSLGKKLQLLLFPNSGNRQNKKMV
jgi:ABC-type Fe3+-siderophore transport system permease subunit